MGFSSSAIWNWNAKKVRKPKPWKHPQPITKSELEQMRDEFWDTTPNYGGQLAAEEAESIWTDKFGFKKLRPDQLSEYRKSCCQMVIFQGTSMLQKEVPIYQLISNIERRELYEHLNQGRSNFLE